MNLREKLENLKNKISSNVCLTKLSKHLLKYFSVLYTGTITDTFFILPPLNISSN